MAEVVGIIGSAFGVIGFACQIIQGCQNISAFLDSVADASDDLRLLRTEVKMFLSLLESFKSILAQIDWSDDPERLDLVRLALDYSNEAVTKLQNLMNEHGNGKQGSWESVKILMKKRKIEKHLGRMEKAKGYILASQTNLLFILHLKKSGLHQDTKETMRAISALNAKANATADIISSVPNQLEGVRCTAMETRDAVENLSRSISREFSSIPAGVNRMLENTLQRTVQYSHDHIIRNTGGQAPCKLSSDEGNTQSSADGVTSSPGRNHINQKQASFSVSTWFGIVIIHSTLVKEQDILSQHGLKIRLGTAQTIRTRVEVTITPCLLRIGLFCSLVWNKLPQSKSGFDVRLRVYNCVEETSPIVQACRDADLESVKWLFGEGKASPFDRLHGNQSLLDIILREMMLLPMRQNPPFALKKLENLYLLFTMMTTHGLDPGQLWCHQNDKPCSSPLAFFATFCFYITPEFVPVILDTTRTIIEHSIQDPYAAADFTDLLRFIQNVPRRVPSPIAELILHQEHWQPDWVIKGNLTPLSRGQEPEKLLPWDAAGFRTWLSYGIERREVLMAAREGFHSLSNAVKFGGLSDGIADRLHYQHLVALLEFGVDFQDDRDGPSVLSLYQQVGNLYPLRAALSHLKWDDNEITEFLEADLVSSLAFQLARLESRHSGKATLPTELQFQLISHSEWRSYIAALDYCSTVHGVYPGESEVAAEDKDISSVSVTAQQKLLIHNHSIKIVRPLRNILPRLIIFLVFVLGTVLGYLLCLME